MDRNLSPWRPVLSYLGKKRWFPATCLLLLGLEVLIGPVLPTLVPETWFLRLYLPWAAIKKTEDFLAGKEHVVLDDQLGWRNNPHASFRSIRYDRLGSRSGAGITPGIRKNIRAVFLGDSRIGGYINIENCQTINACLEDDEIETLNLATDQYGLDQIYLSMQESIGEYHPDVVVIGVSPEVGEYLDSHYLPLVYPKAGLPLMKPRFILENGRLRLRTPPFEAFLRDLPGSPEMLEYLAENDPYYINFQRFRTRKVTPMLVLLSEVKATVNRWMLEAGKSMGNGPARHATNMPLVEALLEASGTLAEEHGIDLICILLPVKDQLRGIEVPAYNEVAAALEKHSLAYVDVLSLLRDFEDPDSLMCDPVHMTYLSNRVIAERLRRMIHEIRSRGAMVSQTVH